MSKVTDGVGNVLLEGQLVRIDLDKPFTIGRITKIDSGGLMGVPPSGDISKAMQMPTIITVITETRIAASPGKSISQVIVIQEPTKRSHEA